MNRYACLLAAALSLAGSAAMAQPIAILFVGNSYTFGRVDPVLSYNAANVHDLTAAFNAVSSTGSNPYEPHPWGGVPGLFKKFTDEAGLNYDVSISARNAATLRGQFLNTANAAWDLRGNVASRVWNTVVLQEQSDAALPAGRGKNANLAQFNAYADQFERFIHNGTAQSYTEAQLYGSLAACKATGASTSDLQHGAQHPGERQRERADQGLPHRHLGSPRHGVRAQDHDARPHDLRRPPDRRHVERRRRRDALLRHARAR